MQASQSDESANLLGDIWWMVKQCQVRPCKSPFHAEHLGRRRREMMHMHSMLEMQDIRESLDCTTRAFQIMQ